jgi:hypothetical protein
MGIAFMTTLDIDDDNDGILMPMKKQIAIILMAVK